MLKAASAAALLSMSFSPVVGRVRSALDSLLLEQVTAIFESATFDAAILETLQVLERTIRRGDGDEDESVSIGFSPNTGGAWNAAEKQ